MFENEQDFVNDVARRLTGSGDLTKADVKSHGDRWILTSEKTPSNERTVVIHHKDWGVGVGCIANVIYSRTWIYITGHDMHCGRTAQRCPLNEISHWMDVTSPMEATDD
jgi:hypothetical protein